MGDAADGEDEDLAAAIALSLAMAAGDAEAEHGVAADTDAEAVARRFLAFTGTSDAALRRERRWPGPRATCRWRWGASLKKTRSPRRTSRSSRCPISSTERRGCSRPGMLAEWRVSGSSA